MTNEPEALHEHQMRWGDGRLWWAAFLIAVAFSCFQVWTSALP